MKPQSKEILLFFIFYLCVTDTNNSQGRQHKMSLTEAEKCFLKHRFQAI